MLSVSSLLSQTGEVVGLDRDLVEHLSRTFRLPTHNHRRVVIVDELWHTDGTRMELLLLLD